MRVLLHALRRRQTVRNLAAAREHSLTAEGGVPPEPPGSEPNRRVAPWSPGSRRSSPRIVLDEKVPPARQSSDTRFAPSAPVAGAISIVFFRMTLPVLAFDHVVPGGLVHGVNAPRGGRAARRRTPRSARPTTAPCTRFSLRPSRGAARPTCSHRCSKTTRSSRPARVHAVASVGGEGLASAMRTTCPLGVMATSTSRCGPPASSTMKIVLPASAGLARPP